MLVEETLSLWFTEAVLSVGTSQSLSLVSPRYVRSDPEVGKECL